MKTNYLQQHFWIKTPIPFFKLFDNESAKQIVLISCFNAKRINFKMFGDKKKWIFYSGERFLDEENCNVIISFGPDNQQILSMDEKHLNLRIKSINQAKNTYTYNIPAIEITTKKLIENIKNGKIYIQLRDQERFQLELLFARKNISRITKDLIAEISLYQDLNTSWRNNFNKYNNLTYEQLIEYKPKFACFIVSNPKCWERNKMFDMLQIICGQKIDSLGKWKRNIDIIIPDRETEQEDYFKLISQYRFMITFENHSLPWYNTEKIYNAFASGTIPIYWGDPLINEVYNPNCFIHISTFNDKKQQTDAIIKGCERIKEIENNLTTYSTFFKENVIINAENEDIRVKKNVNKLYDIFYNL